MRKLDFLIIGAMKGGTSSLAHILYNHPDIFLPSGEIFYFSDDNNYQKGVEWYHKNFNWSKRIIGEKTASYHHDLDSAPKIQDYNPDIKLIWTLRNPVSRAYSHYWHVQKQGGDSRSFETAVSEEMSGKERNFWHLYLRRSIYANQIEHYMRYFPKSQMHFLTFEDLIGDPEKTVNGVLRFLSADVPENFEIRKEPKNQTYVSGFPKMLFAARRLFGKSLPFKVVRKILERRQPGYSKMDPELSTRLYNYFEGPNKKLETLTNLDLSTWTPRK